MLIGVLEIMNELGQIFDRVDIMMWRRRNQADTWCRVPHLGDPGIDFLAWQLAALTGFGTLGHLDLQFLCLNQIITGHPKTPGGNLLNGAVLRIPILHQDIALRILATVASIALAAD